ncbi:MAG: RNA polymerase factor sigma-54 [Akkermansia sp.]|nr:RNA polymerase factor sigma-54 [Akkermansia sp.]
MKMRVSSAGFGQSMQQHMAATAAMQMFMRALQANTAELSEIVTQALASNPALEELSTTREPDRNGDAPAAARERTRRHDVFLESLTEQTTLSAHLEEQIRSSALSPATEAAALAIIPYLNHHGFFAEAPEQVARELGLSASRFQKALRAVQDLDPAGVGAADLRESLILQLQRKGEHGGIPMQLLRDHWDELVRHRYADAARALDVEEEAVHIAARRIARLNPDPGSAFARAELNVITPDIIVTTEDGELTVTLTEDGIPRLALSADYRQMMAEQADKPELRSYLSRCFREGRELIRALNDRQQTILTVAKAIVARQQAFFHKGPEHMAPLKMEDIAADINVSISTISRAVRGKYLKCRFGVFELRRFFTATLPSDGADSHAAGAVQARIRQLIEAESPNRPLSDAAIEASLAQEGIHIARRTVAKYREQLRILPASLRRKK